MSSISSLPEPTDAVAEPVAVALTEPAADPVREAPSAPKTARGARTRAQILKAAESTFGELGYHRTSITDITRAAGVAQGTFYVYFAGKEEILRELVQDLGQQLRAYLAGQSVGADDRIDAEVLGLRAFLEYLAANPSLYRILQETQAVNPALYREYYESFNQGYEAMLATATRKGEIRPGDNAVRAWALMGLSHFLGMRYAYWEQSGELDHIVETMSDFLRNGLGQGPRDRIGT